MKFKLALLSVIAISSISQGRPYPRTILDCPLDLEGNFKLIESSLGEFEVSESHGFDGSGPKGNVALSLLRSERDQHPICEMTFAFSSGGPTKKLQWVLSDSPETPTEVSLEEFGGEKCKFQSRYEASIAKCEMPTTIEPGSKCYKEPSADFTTTIEFGAQSGQQPKLIVYSGGFTIEKYFTAWFNYQKKNIFCVNVGDHLFPYQCSEISKEGTEVKDQSGRVIGTLRPDGKSLVLLDTNRVKILGLTVNDQKTAVFLRNGIEIYLLGDIVAPKRFSSYWRPKALQPEQKVMVSCNGPL